MYKDEGFMLNHIPTPLTLKPVTRDCHTSQSQPQTNTSLSLPRYTTYAAQEP